jgi:hypothetical protein
MELELEIGNSLMPRSRQVKRLSDGELVELTCWTAVRCWIQNSAGHAAAVMFGRKPDGSWHICYDYRGLSAIIRPTDLATVEQLPYMDALLDATRGSSYFTRLY